MPTQYWKLINYKTPIKYFVNTYIREYDLSKANINALLYQGRILPEEHRAFLEMDKQEREVKIGLWIKKDKTVYQDIKSGIIEAKRKLVYANNIEDFDVVSIKNDAMFIVGKDLAQTEFPPFKFNVKNIYTVYLQLQELEIYYGNSVNPTTGNNEENIDVKGMSDDKVLEHQGGMLDLICEACYRLQREDVRITMEWISDIYRRYVTRQLPKIFYKDFDPFSYYRINSFTRTMALGEIDESMVPVVDIGRNLSILRDLLAIISDIYHKQVRMK